jgi:hypothetical protein
VITCVITQDVITGENVRCQFTQGAQ